MKRDKLKGVPKSPGTTENLKERKNRVLVAVLKSVVQGPEMEVFSY